MVLHPRTLADPKVAQRFEREAELAGRLHHPNVVGVVDVGDVEGTRYMVMDFAEGPDLARLLDEAPMRPERIIHLVRQMLEGLYHAHEQGLIHRDFKPENVIIERDAHGVELPRIVDFGIALLREGGDSTDGIGRLTTNGLVLGTPHYMAPEQAVADPIDHRIDLFALGIVIYEMLSGQLPFEGRGAEVARANLLLDPPPIAKRVEHLEVDPLLEAFARRLMAKSRDHRPATAKAARELLDLIERDRSMAARALGVPVARSGRTPAATEPVIAEDGAGSAVTTRMLPTPRHSQLIARPSAPAVPLPDPAVGEPLAAMPPSPAVPVYPGQLARVPDDVLHRGPHAHRAPARDTALRTPLGWPVTSGPSRRRPWLIAGVVVGAASIATAAVLSLTSPNPDEPASGARPAASGSAAATAGATGTSGSAAAPAPDPAPAGRPAAASAQPAEPDADAPASAATDIASPAPRGSAAPPPDVERKLRDLGHRPALAPARVRDKETVPSGGTPVTHPDLESSDPAPVRPPPREVAPRESQAPGADVRGQDARPARAEEPRAVTLPAAPVGIAPGELANLFDMVGREIRQLPGDEQADLLEQLSRFDIMTEMRAEAARRDRVAAQLTQIRDEVRRRRTPRKRP
jgi:serine/threonine-protein kinase